MSRKADTIGLCEAKAAAIAKRYDFALSILKGLQLNGADPDLIGARQADADRAAADFDRISLRLARLRGEGPATAYRRRKVMQAEVQELADLSDDELGRLSAEATQRTKLLRMALRRARRG